MKGAVKGKAKRFPRNYHAINARNRKAGDMGDAKKEQCRRFKIEWWKETKGNTNNSE